MTEPQPDAQPDPQADVQTDAPDRAELERRYPEYRFSAQTEAKETARMVEALKRNKGRTDFVAYAARVIAARLSDDARYYLNYGPYWWPLKEVLQKEGLAYGTYMNRTVADAYRAKTPEGVIVLAELFRERIYEDTWGSGNDTFSLDGKTDWVLRDPDYEAMTIEHFWDDGF